MPDGAHELPGAHSAVRKNSGHVVLGMEPSASHMCNIELHYYLSYMPTQNKDSKHNINLFLSDNTFLKSIVLGKLFDSFSKYSIGLI